MESIALLEIRWKELASKPKTSEEALEIILLAKKIELERAKEYQGLIDELRNINITIESVWDLVNTRSKYPKAIPLLMKYLPLVKNLKNKEAIIRALTVREAKGIAVPLLVNEYRQLSSDDENLKWVIGNAINETITAVHVDSIFPIVLNKENGFTRQMFVVALGKIKSDNVKNVLKHLIMESDKVIRDAAKDVLNRIS